jgi:hypothetical protein
VIDDAWLAASTGRAAKATLGRLILFEICAEPEVAQINITASAVLKGNATVIARPFRECDFDPAPRPIPPIDVTAVVKKG